MKAVLCPVCNGNGLVSAGFYNSGGDYPYGTTSTTTPEQCRSCQGRGYILLKEETNENPFIPWDGTAAVTIAAYPWDYTIWYR